MNSIKQTDLAKSLGVDEMTVVNWEKERNQPLEKNMLRIEESRLCSKI